MAAIVATTAIIPRPYFAGSRIVASIAVAAVALSVVAGVVTVGAGPKGQPVISAGPPSGPR